MVIKHLHKDFQLEAFCVIMPPTQGWSEMPLDTNGRPFAQRKKQESQNTLRFTNLCVSKM